MPFLYPKNIFAASAAEVTSDNVVGYQKIDLSNGYTMIGTSFQNIGVDNSINVQQIKASGLNGLDWDSFAPGDTLKIWDASSQMYLTTLYYAGDEQTESMTGMGGEAGTWFDLDGTFATADLELENGDAFWIISSKEGGKVTVSGEVPTSANSIEIVKGYNMIANPYPKTIKINDLFSISGLAGLDWDSFAPGDTLKVWDASSQMYLTTLYYAGDEQTESMTGMGGEAGTWFDLDGTFATAETEIPAGAAFWIISSGNGTLTFK